MSLTDDLTARYFISRQMFPASTQWRVLEKEEICTTLKQLLIRLLLLIKFKYYHFTFPFFIHDSTNLNF